MFPKQIAFRAHHYHVRRELSPRAPGSNALTVLQVAKAYRFPAIKPVRLVTMGFVSLGGATKPSEIMTLAQKQGWVGPSITAISVRGAGNDPTDQDSTVENMLDGTCQGGAFWAATGKPGTCFVAYAPNDDNGIGDGIDALVKAGCEVVTISWGNSLDKWTAQARAYTAAAIARAISAGVVVVVASGDSSANDGTGARITDYPACDVNALGAGGTRIVLNPDGTISLESAWGDGNGQDEGGGGGFDTTTPQPAYQKGAISSPYRGCPDCAANADPASGWIISANGSEMTVGGTSAAAPFIGGYICACLSALPQRLTSGLVHTMLYPAAATAFNDIVVGSNGYPTTKGYDVVTGLGSINGPGFCAALTSQTPPPIKPPTPPPSGGGSLAGLQQRVDAIFQTMENYYAKVPIVGAELVQVLRIANEYVDRGIRNYVPTGPVFKSSIINDRGVVALFRTGGKRLSIAYGAVPELWELPPELSALVDDGFKLAEVEWPDYADILERFRVVFRTLLKLV